MSYTLQHAPAHGPLYRGVVHGTIADTPGRVERILVSLTDRNRTAVSLGWQFWNAGTRSLAPRPCFGCLGCSGWPFGCPQKSGVALS